MLNASWIAQEFEKCLGWPYVTGESREGAVDCSGLFVYVFGLQGQKIYHGSNTIYRKYCSETGVLTSPKQLCVGMAVFKWNNNGTEPSQYRGDGIGDMQHIGLVTSVNPLRIVHASTSGMAVKVDTKLGNWKYYGKLKDVLYEGDDNVTSMTSIEEQNDKVETEYAYIVSANGKDINFRTKKDTKSALVAKTPRIPCGTRVVLNYMDAGWGHITYNGYDGFVMGDFIQKELTNIEVKPDNIYSNSAMVILNQIEGLVATLKTLISQNEGV